MRTDPLFREFVWLAPSVSVGAFAAVVSAGATAWAGIETGWPAALGAGAAALLLVSAVGLLVVVPVNMILCYFPSVAVWHLVLRFLRARPSERAAVVWAGACTALVASSILVLALLGLFGLPSDRWVAGGLWAIVPVSVAASAWVAGDVHGRSDRLRVRGAR